MNGTTEEDNGVCCKVGRVGKQYDMEGMNEELVARWTGDECEETSVRELTEEFNRRLLRAALDREEIDYLEGEIANTYRLLTDDDVTGGVRVSVRRALNRADVDIEAVETAFVSHQTIYNHLTGCLDASKPRTPRRDPIDREASEMFSLQNRTVAVVDSKLEQLRDQSHLALGGFDVYVDISVFCEECESHHELGQLLRSSGCSCQNLE